MEKDIILNRDVIYFLCYKTIFNIIPCIRQNLQYKFNFCCFVSLCIMKILCIQKSIYKLGFCPLCLRLLLFFHFQEFSIVLTQLLSVICVLIYVSWLKGIKVLDCNVIWMWPYFLLWLVLAVCCLRNCFLPSGHRNSVIFLSEYFKVWFSYYALNHLELTFVHSARCRWIFVSLSQPLVPVIFFVWYKYLCHVASLQ